MDKETKFIHGLPCSSLNVQMTVMGRTVHFLHLVMESIYRTLDIFVFSDVH